MALWGIIVLVGTLILAGFTFFWYKLGMMVSPKDEDSPIKAEDNCYLHKSKAANLLWLLTQICAEIRAISIHPGNVT